MVEQNNNQQGSTLLIVVIALLVLVGAGLGGWYVLNHKDKDSKTAKDNSQQSKMEDQEDEKQVSPTESPYLDVSEWGVRITLPKNLQGDISYYVNNNAPSGDPQIVFLSKKVTDSDLACADVAAGNKKIITGFYRYDDASGVAQTDPPAFKTVAGSSYYWRGTSCKEALDRGEGSAELKQIVVDLEKAITDTLQTSTSN